MKPKQAFDIPCACGKGRYKGVRDIEDTGPSNDNNNWDSSGAIQTIKCSIDCADCEQKFELKYLHNANKVFETNKETKASRMVCNKFESWMPTLEDLE